MNVLTFEDWFQKASNTDLRIPIACGLSFKDKLTLKEWRELIDFVYNKVNEGRDMEDIKLI